MWERSCDDPSWAEPWQSPWTDGKDPQVLVGLSSTYQHQELLMQRIVRALSSLDVRCGGHARSHAVVRITVRVDIQCGRGRVGTLTQLPFSNSASVVISHCGHGTTMRALRAGVPMVCIPMGRDQNDTAARVVHHGAGIRLSPRASSDRIRSAVQEVLSKPAFAMNARRLAAIIADEHRPDAAAVELEHVIDLHVGAA